MAVKIIDRLPRFKQSLYIVLDDALKEGARDIRLHAKEKAPYKMGHLRANSDFKQIGILKWRVSFWEVYARFQEFGGDGKRRIRNYTTAGTGKHYLKNAGDEMVLKLKSILKKHASRAK